MAGDIENNIPLLFEDFDLLTERLGSLTDSYRLLVGAAEELTRTPSAGENVIESAINRSAFLGNVIDQILLILQIALILDFFDIDNDTDNNKNPYM